MPASQQHRQLCHLTLPVARQSSGFLSVAIALAARDINTAAPVVDCASASEVALILVVQHLCLRLAAKRRPKSLLANFIRVGAASLGINVGSLMNNMIFGWWCLGMK